MPPRRRASAPKDGWESALDEVARRVAAEDDPLERLRLATRYLGAIEAHANHLSRLRVEAVRDLLERGWSYRKIAQATGLSKSRVGQLAQSD